MDEFESRLKRDAEAVQAEISPQLRSRIDASLRGVEPIKPVPAPRSASPRLWWASSLTGLAAVIALVLIGTFNRPDSTDVQEVDVIARTEPLLPVDLPLLSPELDIRSAEFVSPLEEELLKLRSDLEKARENVRQDVDFSF
jgi:hypothetical protein